VFSKANNRILFISDIHIPYQDNKALELALQYGKDKKINTILLGGDIMDMYATSDHEKLPGARDLNEEIEATFYFLSSLKKHFPECNIYYKEGNHERRWLRFLMRKSPEIIGVHEFRLDVILKLGQLGITWIPNEQLIKAGDLNIIHGNEMKGGSNNQGKFMFDRAKKSILAGDKHKTNEHIESNIDGEVYGGWGVGCLCELQPDYLLYNRWNLGFAYIEVENNGNFSVENKKNEVEELTETIANLYKKELYEGDDDGECYEKIEGFNISEIIVKIANSKVKDYKSLSNKALFKFMDLIDM
jgi:predicted phosphodiesterase